MNGAFNLGSSIYYLRQKKIDFWTWSPDLKVSKSNIETCSIFYKTLRKNSSQRTEVLYWEFPLKRNI